MSNFREKFDPAVWRIVKQIPAGSVLSYGQVAALAGYPRHSRQVAQALRRSEEPLPWHRVIKTNFNLASGPDAHLYKEQMARLKAEGVVFDNGRIVAERSREESDSEALDRLLWGPEPD